MEIYRISKREFASIDGIGGLLYSGRWHQAGYRVVYAAQHRSLAALEYLVHLNGATLLLTDYVIATISIPEEVDVEIVDVTKLHPQWTGFRQNGLTQQIGTEFLKSARNALLRIPSAIILGEFNYLINPLHYSSQQFKVLSVNDFIFDGRLVKS